MTADQIIFRNGPIFDGDRLHDGAAAVFSGGRLSAIGPECDVPAGGRDVDLSGDILSPGYADLQVNGGDGVMLNDDPSVETIARIAKAHRGLGVTTVLPTLITDTPEKTRAAVDAARQAVATGIGSVAGLHLEGPHLSVTRKGAHDAGLIRPMEEADLDLLLAAAGVLPFLKVTVAPENVTEAQVEKLARAGVLVSLGHSDADFETCRRYIRAGARCVTHLFNAMSQLGSRAPGLVGAALAHGEVHAGLIADSVHVHPETIRAAWAAKTGPGRIFLVSDAMAVAGTDETEFQLGGRQIRRRDGVLTLADGTLAGADLDLTTALRVMTTEAGIPFEDVLRAATSVPRSLLTGGPAQTSMELDGMIRIRSDLSGLAPLP